MLWRPPMSTRTEPPFTYPTLFRPGRQEVGAGQLAERGDDIVLGRRVLAEFRDQFLPQFLNPPLAVEAADEQIGAARETVRAAGRPVVDHIGCRAAITEIGRASCRERECQYG